MSLLLSDASQPNRKCRHQPLAFGGRVRSRAEFETDGATGPENKTAAGHRSPKKGSLSRSQIESIIIVGAAATYSEELATCFEDAQDSQALQQLRKVCCKTLKSISPMTSSQASKENKFWPALNQLSEPLETTVRPLPDGQEMLEAIFKEIKPKNGYEDAAKYASGAHKASRIEFWEMIVSQVQTVEEALARASE